MCELVVDWLKFILFVYCVVVIFLVFIKDWISIIEVFWTWAKSVLQLLISSHFNTTSYMIFEMLGVVDNLKLLRLRVVGEVIVILLARFVLDQIYPLWWHTLLLLTLLMRNFLQLDRHLVMLIRWDTIFNYIADVASGRTLWRTVRLLVVILTIVAEVAQLFAVLIHLVLLAVGDTAETRI